MISELDWALFVREDCSLFARTHSSSKADSLIALAVSGCRVTNVLRAQESRYSRHPPKYEMVFPSLQVMMVERRRGLIGASLLG